MLSITQVCDQYAALYCTAPIVGVTWDHVIPTDGAYVAVKRVDGIDYVMFRGSTTLLDWIDDFDDCALPFNDPVLGDVHPGARLGVLAVRGALDGFVGPHVVCVGHSLGAMHAAIYAAYRVASGKPVDAVIMFGEPRPGGPNLSAILANTHVESYRNADAHGHDIVTDVARSLPPMLPYQHVKEPLTDVHIPPRGDDIWAAFKYHHFCLYARAFGCGGPAPNALYADYDKPFHL